MNAWVDVTSKEDKDNKGTSLLVYTYPGDAFITLTLALWYQ